MKTAVITGASSGLGREFVRQFYSVFPEIERVWLIARRMDRLQELAAACMWMPPRLWVKRTSGLTAWTP